MTDAASKGRKLHFIVLATDPASGAGGIATAMPGFMNLLQTAGFSSKLVATHCANIKGGKWRPLVRAIPAMLYEVQTARHRGEFPVAWLHVGGPVSSLRKFFFSLILWLFRVPIVIQLHSANIQRYLESPIAKRLFFLSLYFSKKVVVLTRWWETVLREHGFKGPLGILPNVLSEELEFVASLPLIDGLDRQDALAPSLKVLSMSRLVAGKGFDRVVEAIGFCDAMTSLTIAGDGPIRREIENLVLNKGLQSRVAFAGWVNSAKKGSIISDCDVFCLPTEFDAFGMVFIEAMAHGKPVVALSGGPTADVVPDRDCGILVPPNEPEALPAALEELRQSPQLREKMGRQAKQWVLERYSRKNLIPNLNEIAQSLYG